MNKHIPVSLQRQVNQMLLHRGIKKIHMPYIKVRLGYCFTPYQRLWLYNGVPLVASYDTLGIWRTYSRLKTPGVLTGTYIKAIISRKQGVAPTCLSQNYQ